METTPSALRATLGFTKAEHVSADHERPGTLRAQTVPPDADPTRSWEYHSCDLYDLAAPETPEMTLPEAGFQSIDLSGNVDLQQALDRVRDEDRVSEESAEALRASLRGAHLPLGEGRSLHVEHIADEGLIQRRAGPNGLDVNPGGIQGSNGHGGAPVIHADQDVFGTPLHQLMNGEAPNTFRHQTHDTHNHDSSLFLLNLWIPIQQITRPLVLMDRRTLDQDRHQLRYALPVTRFLDRDEQTNVNDIWAFLPHPEQKWYFRSAMGPDQGYVFDTLGAPHGACILPGEPVLERLHLDLGQACDAASDSDATRLREIAAASRPDIGATTTPAIRKASSRMAKLLDEAKLRADEVCAASEDWTARARTAMDAVIRKSVEMRLVATLQSQ